MHDDLALYILGALEDPREFEAHLGTCEQCRAELARLRGTLDVLDAGIVRTPAPVDLRMKTLAAVRASGVAGTPAPERTVVESRTSDVVSIDRTRARRIRIASIAAVAALALVAAGLGYRAFTGESDSFTADRTIALAAADGSAARGEARIDDTDGGQVIELTVSGLPDAPAGMYYECWWVGAGDADDVQNRVSAGTFRKGDATYRMQSSADPAKFQAMGVTLEPDDGNPKRTGTKVLGSPPAPGASPTVSPASSAPPAAVRPSPAASVFMSATIPSVATASP